MLAEKQTERRILSGGIFQKFKAILAIELLLAENDPERSVVTLIARFIYSRDISRIFPNFSLFLESLSLRNCVIKSGRRPAS